MGRESSGTPTSTNQRTRSPKSLIWSMVCGAPVSRSSGGRSAVTTIRGTRAEDASTTAGRKFAAALPEVQTIATGRRAALASPSAKNPADRSSSDTRVSMGERPKAIASGAERDPEQTIASRTPAAWSARTKRSVHVTLRAPRASAPRASWPWASTTGACSRTAEGSVTRDRIQDSLHLEIDLSPFQLGVRAFHDSGAREDPRDPILDGDGADAHREITVALGVHPPYGTRVPPAILRFGAGNPGQRLLTGPACHGGRGVETRDEIQDMRAGARPSQDLGPQVKQVRKAHHLGCLGRVDRLADRVQGLEEMLEHDPVLAAILLAPGKLLPQDRDVVPRVAPQRSRHRLGEDLASAQTDQPLRARAQERVARSIGDEEPVAMRVCAAQRIQDREDGRGFPEGNRVRPREHDLGEFTLTDPIEGLAHDLAPARASHRVSGGSRGRALGDGAGILRRRSIHPPPCFHGLARARAPERSGRNCKESIGSGPSRPPHASAVLREGKPADRDGPRESSGSGSPMLRVREKGRKPLASLLEPAGATALHAARRPDSREGLSPRRFPEEKRLPGRKGSLTRQAFPGGMSRHERAFAREGAGGGASLGRSHGRQYRDQRAGR